MKNLFAPAKSSTLLAAVLAVSSTFAAASTQIQPSARITAPIDNATRTVLPNSKLPQAIAANDIGAVPASTKLNGITIVFNRTPTQQAALDALIAAQQTPGSPQFHQWLTPAQFGAQFGLGDSDLAAVQSWLQQQGFTIEAVSNSRDQIRFAGTEGQVESAFGTQLHYFKTGTETHFAPASAISVPAAIAGTVLAVSNLSDFHPHSRVKLHAPLVAQPNFTSSQTGNFYLDPKDLETMYNVTPLYNSGYNGAGQTIVIVGQSFVFTSDIANFQTALGLPTKAPNLILMPNTGTAAIDPLSTGDMVESDLDIEYSGALAPGATIDFVYTGNTDYSGAFDSLAYAVDEKLGQIISSSYGDCEADLGSTNYTTLNAILQQAAAQGQTVISASGDNGSTDCYEDTGDGIITTAGGEALAVDFPASSQYVTGLGGTEIPSADLTSTYFQTSSGTDVISSVKSYIPEQVWNDDSSTNGLNSGGGGTSAFTSRPTWQTGVTGIPAGTFRLIPDLALDASNSDAPLLYCSSDTATGVTGSCSNGFRDSSDKSLTVAGGTSFAAPTFAGMLAVLSQAKGYGTGQGLINPTLYTLAANSTTYASAFHDTTAGSNECLAGALYCIAPATTDYPATTGYDEASGLGSINLQNLVTAWPSATTSALAASTVSLSAATTAPAASANDVITIVVSGTTLAPTGTVSVTVDGSVVNAALALIPGTGNSSTASYTFNSSTAGSHVIVVTYSGSLVYAPSTSSINVVVGGTAAATLTATNISVTQGSTGTSTLTLTPQGGYTGTFQFLTIDISPSTASGLCASDPANISITGTTPGTSSISISTAGGNCSGSSIALVKGATGHFANGTRVRVISSNDPTPVKPNPLPTGFTIAGLLAIGFVGRRSRMLPSLLAVGLLGILGLALSGCSNTTSTTAPSTPAAKGTYVLTLAGSDTVNPTITASTTFTLTVN